MLLLNSLTLRLYKLISLCQLLACAVFAASTEPVMRLKTRLPGSSLLLCKRFCKLMYMLSKIHWASECTVGKASMILRRLSGQIAKIAVESPAAFQLTDSLQQAGSS